MTLRTPVRCPPEAIELNCRLCAIPCPRGRLAGRQLTDPRNSTPDFRAQLGGKGIAQRQSVGIAVIPPKEWFMGSRRQHTVGLAAFALLGSGLFAVPALAGQAAAQHSAREGVVNSKAVLETTPANNVGNGRTRVARAPAPAVGVDNPPAAAPSAPGAPAAAPPSSARPAAPVAAPVPVVSVPAPAPSGLSADAPEIPPTISVVGGGNAPSGPSPAATPEPSTLLLMATGLVGLYRMRRRR